ncbi:ABC transporter permease [Rhodobacteraceae bacterium F11138]|nr:ABC transporter permease [Rhodobacteraceae bacterium F11138]
MSRTAIGNWLAAPIVAAIATICLAPLAILFLFSFFSVDFVNIVKEPTFKNYWTIASSSTYRGLIAQAFLSALVVVCITGVIGHPVAYFIAKRVKSAKSAFLVLLLVPLYTGDLVRIFAWRVLLGTEGALNTLLLWVGVIDVPIEALLFSPLATHVVLVYNFLPFMVLGLWLSYESLDDHLLEAAGDLGASGMSAFRRVTFPLTAPGLIAGGLMVFVMAVGEYLTPQLVGGASGITIISAINDLFGTAFDWPLGSAIAWTMLAILGFFFAASAVVLGRTNWARAVVGGE